MDSEGGLSRGIKPGAVVRLVGLILLGVVALLLVDSPPPHNLHPGFAIFLVWAGFCVAAVLARRMLVWAALGLLPLALVTWDAWGYFAGPVDNAFGYYPWGAITLFTGMCLVIAATGTMSIVLTSFRDRGR